MPPSDPIYRVLPRQVNQTLAACLRDWLPKMSWTQIRRLIETRRIMVSGNLCTDQARRLKLQDVVKLLDESAPPPPTDEAVKIRYVDEHVVVVEKPSGVTSTRHSEEKDWPARRRQVQPTLDEMLPRIIARRETKQGKRKGKLLPVKAVHRLDRDTSGLMVFARTTTAERALGLQFRRHTTQRCYVAVARGEVQSQTIASQLVRDRGDGRRGSTTLPDVGKRAVTHVKMLERIGSYTLLECRLETGRTHQIRIHLAELGHPLCGEKVYNQPKFTAPLPDDSKAPRLALHAAEIGFEHPITGEKLEFSMPLPADLEQFVARLRRESKR